MPPWINAPAVGGAQRAARVQARASADRGWYQIKNAAAADEAELLIYDEIGCWYGSSADQFVADLRAVTAPALRVRINSPGGNVFEGITIANALRSHPGQVTVQVDGLAASIASVIAMAGTRLEMMPNSMLMVHDASGMCWGDAAEMTKMAEVLGLISDNIADVYAAKTGGTRDEWRAVMQAETWYLPADAVAAGLADEVVPGKPVEPAAPAEPGEPAEPAEPEMSATAWDLTAYGYAGPPKAAAPKPGPPPAAKEQPTQSMVLTINLGDAVGEDMAAMLRAAITAPPVSAEPVAGPAETPAAGPEPTPTAPAPAAPTEPAAVAEPDPEWDEILANLTTSPADAWAAHLARLTQPASSSATES